MKPGRKKWAPPVPQKAKNKAPAAKKHGDKGEGKGKGRKRSLERPAEGSGVEAAPAKRLTRSRSRGANVTAETAASEPGRGTTPTPPPSAVLPPEKLYSVVDPQPLTSTPTKQCRVHLVDISSPVRADPVDRDARDVAPSPITPLLPLRIPATVKTADDDVPSPLGMNLTLQLSNLSQPFITQSVFIKQEPAQAEETVYFDAQDVSLSESAQGLDLDCLIDEIFVKNFSGSDLLHNTPLEGSDTERNDLPKEAIVNHDSKPEVNNETGDCDIHLQNTQVGKQDPVYPQRFSKEDSNSNCTDSKPKLASQPSVSAPALSEEVHVESVERASSTVRDNEKAAPSIPIEAQVRQTVGTENKCIDNSSPDSKADVSSTSNEQKILNENHALPPLDIASQTYPASSSQDPNNEKFLNEETFGDLTLSDSQFLDIDVRCGLLKEIQVEPRDKTPMLECPLKDAPQTSPGKTSEPQASPHFNLEFSVPDAPQMNWVPKILDSCQRLRMVTQEISRLNAMVLRARRTLWPQQQNTMMHQHPVSLTGASKSSQPVTVPQKQPGVPNLYSDPDWNIS